MDKKEINSLIKKVEEYKVWHKDGKSKDPFSIENAYWAAGFEYFLIWLKEHV